VSQLAVDASRLPRARPRALGKPALSSGLALGYLSVIVLVPLAALSVKGAQGGWHHFWQVAWNPESKAALELTLGLSLAVVAVNAVTGVALAWTLVRDEFPGKGIVNTLIDLPFALPTIVAGLLVLALYGPTSPVHISVAFTRTAIYLVLLFVTLPFVVRTVQPVLLELDVEMEEAARSLGAGELTVFRRVILPTILPGILSGVTLAFARAVGEIGAIVIISGNLPYRTELA
jgi:sulfate transport system permease protein